MLNVKQIAEQAASEFGLSLKDDPTAWPAGAATLPGEVVRAANAAARDNARSALARVLGQASEAIATAMDVAISEDGPLADLPAVLAQHVNGLDADLSGVVAAADWQGRVDALREALSLAVAGYQTENLTPAAITEYINADPRLSGLAVALKYNAGVSIETSAAMTQAVEAGELTEADIPAFLKNGGPATPEAVDTEWDDTPAPAEPDGWADEPAAPAKGRRKAATAPAGPPPKLSGLVVSGGITDGEMAVIMGLSKSYYSLIRNGRRPWPGLLPSQAEALYAEATARAEALSELLAALDAGDVLKPAGDGA